MKKKLMYNIATLLSIAALAVVSTASFLYVGQPEAPEELLK